MVVAECASSDIPPIGIVRGLHVVDCLGQLRRSGRGVVGREGLAVVAELRGPPTFVTRVSDQAKPVMAVAAMAETPMSPVISESATVEMPDLVRIT
jgi:hypothetical protein